MSIKAEDLPDFAELERLAMRKKLGEGSETLSAAEIEEMLKSLDGVVVSDDELVQAPGLNEIANYLECALARAKDIDDPVLKWLIRSSLEHVRK